MVLSMLVFDEKYFVEKYKSGDLDASYKLLGGIFINNFVDPEKLCIRGNEENNSKLTNVYREDKIEGYEVVRCEPQSDFGYAQFLEGLLRIKYNYNEYLKIKKINPNHIFNKVNTDFKVENGKIVALSDEVYCNSVDLMIESFREVIHTKLTELNNGAYDGCSKVSLVILSLNNENGVLSDEQLHQIYLTESQKFKFPFYKIFYITPDGMAVFNTVHCKELRAFYEGEYSNCFTIRNQILKISQSTDETSKQT